MSYILEALKRSEQERHQGELTHATIDTIMMPSRQVHHQWWPYLLIVILAINVIAYLYFQLSEGVVNVKDEQTVVYDKESISGQQQVAEEDGVPDDIAPVIKIAEKPLPEHLLQTPSLTKRYDLSEASTPSLVQKSYQAKSKNYTEDGFEIIAPKAATTAISSESLMLSQAYKDTAEIKRNVQDSDQINEHQETLRQEKHPDLTQKEVVIQAKVESFEDIYHLNDLDLNFQKGVPDIRFNSHIYSTNPADRRVMINDLYLREGQSFSGITIDTIGEFYIVLVKSSQRFKIPVLRDWFTPQ